ncbi:MAG: glycosyltransferase, partial [Chitinophagales bacterium]
MKDITSNISYIIAFRATNIERIAALVFVLKKLRNYFPDLEILVVEQDSEAKLDLDANLNVKHLFIFNSGLFNKGWSFNLAEKHTQKSVLAFGDADIFLEKEDYLSFFKSAENFEAITPNMTEAINVRISDANTLKYENIDKRPLFDTFAGGLVILTREGFEKIGGWDERFEGWGCEDNAVSHVIYNTLTSKTYYFPMYHIDHPRSQLDGKEQVKYEENKNLMAEILSMNETPLLRYIQYLQDQEKGIAEKYTPTAKTKEASTHSRPLQFVLAITTFNRLDYLKICIQSFLKTRTSSPMVSWKIIVADDGSMDGTKAYLVELQSKHPIHVIYNERIQIQNQVNTILKYLTTIEFDVCFKSDDDVVFRQSGWDILYWQTMERTGYQHLVYYDKRWRPHANLQRPISFGHLESNCLAENIQGAFYTLTKAIIQQVGYFDTQRFSGVGLDHVDYSFRCCRAGFNVLKHPFDVKNSNDFIRLQGLESYTGALTSKYKSLFNSKETVEYKKEVMH